MISLQVSNSNVIFDELNVKVLALKELQSNASKSQIAKAVFTITSKQFIKDITKQSVIDPKKYFHLYEWNGVGIQNKKLFTIKRQSFSNGNLKINFKFQQSRTPVPVPSALSRSKKKGVSKRSIFANKADVMENGRPVTFTTKQYIVFLSQKDNKVHFIPPKTLIRNNNPGGRQTKFAFDSYIKKWYSTKSEIVVEKSKLFENLGIAVTRSLDGKGKNAYHSKEAIRIVTEKYAQGVSEL